MRAVELLHGASFLPRPIINLTDTGPEGRWRWVSGQPVSYFNWPLSEPNGAQLFNCAVIELARGGRQDGWWSDISSMGVMMPTQQFFVGLSKPSNTCSVSS